MTFSRNHSFVCQDAQHVIVRARVCVWYDSGAAWAWLDPATSYH